MSSNKNSSSAESASSSASFLASLYGRGKTLSECSGTDVSEHLPAGSELMGLNLEAENHLYDMDGVFAYTYFTRKAEMYDDVDGKVRYKFFNQLKRPEVSRVQGSNSSSSNSRQRSQSESSAASSAPSTGGMFNKMEYDSDGKFAYRVFDARMDGPYFKQPKKE